METLTKESEQETKKYHKKQISADKIQETLLELLSNPDSEI